SAPKPVTEGVLEALHGLVREIGHAGCGPVLLVAHSTTHAVNALLEGDTAVVGVLGMGHPPDLKRADKRTRVGEIKRAPGRTLSTKHAFVGGDVIGDDEIASALRSLVSQGAEAVCVSEAYGVDDPSGERRALEIAESLDIAACAGHELSGLYGL